ncbi:MAG: replication-relaxation family protein [Flavobacteriaceae bacterium]
MSSTKRKPRLRRSRFIRRFLLTNRDIEIIHHVFRHRYLRSTHIHRLVGGSKQGILRRLQLLYHHGYLDRPLVQLEYFSKRHNKPLVYGVARKGAQILIEECAIPKERINWMLGKRTKSVFLEHTLEIADFMVNIETKWIKESGYDLIREETLQANHRTLSRWKVQLRQNTQQVTHYIEPDGLFALKLPAKPNEEIGIILEVDRGTMPVTRKNLHHSSIQRKLLAYERLWKQGFFKKNYGWKRIRILFIIASSNPAKRKIKISKTFDQFKPAHGLFLIEDNENFTTALIHTLLNGNS